MPSYDYSIEIDTDSKGAVLNTNHAVDVVEVEAPSSNEVTDIAAYSGGKVVEVEHSKAEVMEVYNQNDVLELAVVREIEAIEVLSEGPQGPKGEKGDPGNVYGLDQMETLLGSHIVDTTPHPAYDDSMDLVLLFENGVAS